MALSADVQWEIRANGNTDNGGGFVTGASGVDYSQQDAAQYALTAVTTAAANAILLHASAATDMVGNIARVVSGTNFIAGYYEIISVSAGVSITLDRNCTTAAGASGVVNVGGAGILEDKIIEAAVAGHRYWIKKDGTHTLTASINTALDGTNGAEIRIEGYNSARGDGYLSTNRPVIAQGSNIFIVDNFWHFANLDMTGTGNSVLDPDQSTVIVNCKIDNTSLSINRQAVDVSGGNAILVNCELLSAAGSGIEATTNTIIIGCYIHDCDVAGILATSAAPITVVNTVIDTCDIGMSFGTNVSGISLQNVTVYNCTKGIESDATSGTRVYYGINLIIDNCTTGMDWAFSDTKAYWDRINFSNNGTDKVNINNVHNETALDPQFVDAANGDFTPGANMDIGLPFPGGLNSTASPLGALPIPTGGVSGFVGSGLLRGAI